MLNFLFKNINVSQLDHNITLCYIFSHFPAALHFNTELPVLHSLPISISAPSLCQWPTISSSDLFHYNHFCLLWFSQ